MTKEEKMEKVLEDEVFVEEVRKAVKGSAEDVQKLFMSKDVDLSADEANALCVQAKQEAGEELTDDELSLVAGGLIGTIAAGLLLRRIIGG